MKKLITLLTLLTMLGGGKLWADTETIFSANPTTALNVPASTQETQLTSANATISGGFMYYINDDTKAYDFISNKNSKMAFSIGGSKAVFKVTLNKALEDGDVISAIFCVGSVKGSDGLWFGTTSTRATPQKAKAILETGASASEYKSCSYTVETGDDKIGRAHV